MGESDAAKLMDIAEWILDSGVDLSDLMAMLRSHCLDQAAGCRRRGRDASAEAWEVRSEVFAAATKRLSDVDG